MIGVPTWVSEYFSFQCLEGHGWLTIVCCSCCLGGISSPKLDIRLAQSLCQDIPEQELGNG